jgi:hypothetical protein
MKKIFFAGLLMLAISTASFAKEFVAGGKTYTSVGDYKIEIADDPVMINNVQYKAYIISYENSPLQVKVVVMKGKDCKNFVVLSDKLNVQYVCNKDYFGIKKLDASLTGYTTSVEAMNRSAYFHQRVLTSGQGSEMENTQLIAAYFPMLINGEVIASM